MGLGQRLAHSIASSSSPGSARSRRSARAPARTALATVRRSPREPDACALRARMQAFAREQRPAARGLLVVGAHRAEQLLARHHAGFRIVGGLTIIMAASVSLLVRARSQFRSSPTAPLLDERAAPESTSLTTFFGRTPLRRDRDPARLRVEQESGLPSRPGRRRPDRPGSSPI